MVTAGRQAFAVAVVAAGLSVLIGLQIDYATDTIKDKDYGRYDTMKKKMAAINIFAVTFGMIASRFLAARYGNNGRVILGLVTLWFIILCILPLFFMKKYLVAIVLLILVLPAAAMVLGVYLENLYIVLTSIVSILVLIPILIKVLKKFAK